MEYFKINPQNPDLQILDRAVQVLKKGGIIVYPTDTLYGLGVDVLNSKAVSKLFLLKRRKTSMPLSFLIESIEKLEQFIGELPAEKKSQINKLLPGKYTILIEKNKPGTGLNAEQLSGHRSKNQKIGFRIPAHRWCHELTTRMAGPISSTSANISGQKNVLSIPEVISHFGNKPDLVLDAGVMPDSRGSTIIDFTKNPYLVMRQGEISLAEVQHILEDEKVTLRKEKFNLIFICSGNICRSPMAEGILKTMVNKTKYKNFVEISSAGTLDLISIPAHDFSLKVAEENEIDIRSHRSRPVSTGIIDCADLIFCMALNHFNFLKEKFPEQKNKFVLLKEWQRKTLLTNPSIADPIGHELEFFRKTYAEIFSELKRVFPFLVNEIKGFMEYNELY